MQLSKFITEEIDLLSKDFAEFAQTHLDGVADLSQEELHDHILRILTYIAADMGEKQTQEEQDVKSKGDKPMPKGDSVAQTHGDQRLDIGLSIVDLAREYRALRANILKEWAKRRADEPDEQDFHDMVRFNEAIDEIQIEALTRFHSRMQKYEKTDEQKNEFIAVLGHELRNPLSAISGAVEIIKIKPDKMAGMLEVLEKSVRRIALLLDDMLDLNRISHGTIKLKKEIYDLRETIKLAGRDIAEAVKEKEQRLKIDVPKEPLCVKADPVRMEQVIVNLLTNARKYTQKGGSIELVAGQEGDNVVMTVQDNGMGIPPDKLEEIFEPFSRIKHKFGTAGGLGIGLALVKQLVEQHCGEVRAHSEGENKGATFTVTLPLIKDVKKADIKETVEDKTVKLPENLKVLIVDDEPGAVIGTEAFLEKNSCIVRKVDSADDAIKVAQDFIPDVFLLDIGMPGMNGYELSRYLRDHDFEENLIIAVSGYGHEDAHEMSMDAGMDYHLNKPIDYNILARILSAVVPEEHSG